MLSLVWLCIGHPFVCILHLEGLNVQERKINILDDLWYLYWNNFRAYARWWLLSLRLNINIWLSWSIAECEIYLQKIWIYFDPSSSACKGSIKKRQQFVREGTTRIRFCYLLENVFISRWLYWVFHSAIYVDRCRPFDLLFLSENHKYSMISYTNASRYGCLYMVYVPWSLA